ncbi:MAG: L-seryl-tRNA(Sec) selenium transferase, partial [Candidatus Glassbacteria bacterium]
GTVPSREELFPELIEKLSRSLSERTASTLRRVITATGTIIHTNLGRSLLPVESIEALEEAGTSYTTLEYDIDKGARGSRHIHCEQMLIELTGCEASLIVNNNAAAVLLAMNTLSADREAIVSRGELVEIGGSFRMPEVMGKSNAIMVEVGTTNRTRLSDYENAIGENTGLLVKVHRSNFKMVGFVEGVRLEELVALGRKHNVPVLHDIGSGLLLDLSQYGLGEEPIVAESVKAGASVVTFSGDKLLGGPQAGIIVGKKTIVDMMRKNPLTRAFRVDKLTIAALEATLRLYYDPEEVLRSVPVIDMITTDPEVLRKRAEEIIDRLDEECIRHVEVCEGESIIGGGSCPGVKVRSIELRVTSEKLSANEIESIARKNDPPILGRIHDDTFTMDLRTIREDETDHISRFLARILGE